MGAFLEISAFVLAGGAWLAITLYIYVKIELLADNHNRKHHHGKQ